MYYKAHLIDIVTTQIFLRHTTDVRSDSGCPTPCDGCSVVRWMRRCALSDTLHPTRPSVPMFSFLLRLKYFSDIPRTSSQLRMSDSAQWPRHFFIIGQLAPNSAECSDVFPFITFHLSFFQIYFHSYLDYLISDISRGTCI